MISTVTTTTTTTTTTTATGSITSDIGLLAVISLIVLLVVKELAGSALESGGGELRSYSTVSGLNKVLNVGIVPLLFAFSFIVADKVVQILG